MKDLDKLIKAIEGRDTLPMDGTAYRLFGDGWLHVFDAYHGSLDAAKALHESLLDSGFHAEIWACCTRPRVKVVRLEEVHDGHEQVTEARSWLIAALKAHRSLQ